MTLPTQRFDGTSDALQNFVLIGGGEFMMGSPAGEVDRQTDETQHQVSVSDFYMCKYAVTLAEFRRFVEASGHMTEAEKDGFSYIVLNHDEVEGKEGINWRHGASGEVRSQAEENHPVLHVSWDDAVAYCAWMTEQTGKKFRLPTEAEWEYACRAGTTTPFNTGENITTAQANYDGNYPYRNNPKGLYRENTVAVDSFAPNGWGLYNMHGNVFEWCSDWYDENYYDKCKAQGTVENPLGPDTGLDRVLRGGGWDDDATLCRSAYRGDDTSDDNNINVSFRVVFVP